MYNLYCGVIQSERLGDAMAILTSRGPSHTARWFPVGESDTDAKELVGNGKC